MCNCLPQPLRPQDAPHSCPRHRLDPETLHLGLPRVESHPLTDGLRCPGGLAPVHAPREPRESAAQASPLSTSPVSPRTQELLNRVCPHLCEGPGHLPHRAVVRLL